MTAHVVFLALRWAEQLTQIALVFLLLRRRLFGPYRWFGCYLIVRIARALSLIAIDPGTLRYARAWADTEPILLLLEILAIYELTRKVLDCYPKIGKFASVVVGCSLAIGTSLGSAGAALTFQAGTSPAWLVDMRLAVRVLDSMACAFLVVFALWFLIFPVPMRPNISRHRWLLVGFSGIVPALGTFLVELFIGQHLPHAALDVNFGVMAAYICLMLGWCFLLTPAGEIEPRIDPLSPEDARERKRDYEAVMSTVRREIRWRKLFAHRSRPAVD